MILLAGAARGGVFDRVVAMVDGRPITRSQVNEAILTGAMEPQSGEAREDFEKRVLSEMIDEELRYRDARRFSPAPPDPTAVQKAYDALVGRLRAQGKNPDAEFASSGLSPEGVRERLARQLVVSQFLNDRFAALVFVSPDDTRQEYDGPFTERCRVAGRAVPAYADVVNDLREEIRTRREADEVDKWTKELRAKARITILESDPPLGKRNPAIIPG
jgi:hypothetical protein